MKFLVSLIGIILLCSIEFCTINQSCNAVDPSCSPLIILEFSRAASPRFVYSANLTAGTINGYSVDHVSGNLTAFSSSTSIPNTNLITVHPNGRFLYSANVNPASTTTVYQIDQSSGTLTLANTIPMAGNNPYIAVPDSTGRFAYVVNNTANTIGTYSLDGATGNMTSVGSVASNGTNPNFIAIHPGGQYLYVANKNGNNISAFSINNGTLALIGQVGITNPIAVAIDPFGRYAYGTDLTSLLKIFSIGSDGNLTQIGTAPTGTFNTFVCVSANGRFVYVTNQTTSDVSVLSSGSSGLTLVGNRSSGGTTAVGCATEPTGNYLYINNTGSGNFVLFKIDRTSGDITLVQALSAGAGAQGIAVQTQPGF